jgi:hypothetical protein
MKRRDVLFGAAAAVVGAGAIASPAQAATWVLLGERRVSLLSDRDRVRVGIADGLFSRILLQVDGNAIFMQDLKVTFVNGDTADLAVRVLIPDGDRTRAINLPGVLRAIRHIDLRYRRVPLGGRARVRVYGLRA